MSQRILIQEKTIVGFLDILGYDKLVRKMIKEVDFIKYFDESMYGISVNLLDTLKKSKRPAKATATDFNYVKEVMSTIKMRYVFDNLIVSLPLSHTSINSQEFDNETITSHCIEAFFIYMALVSTFIISKVNHLFRGGISVGEHYEAERENYLFIFSQAHNQAVRLEKDDTKHPRILLDDRLRADLIKRSFPHMDKFFYKDDDGFNCFDIYSSLSVFNEQRIIQTMTEIKEALQYHIEKNSEDTEVLSKLIYFARYHNRKISTGGLNLPDLCIDMNTFLKDG